MYHIGMLKLFLPILLGKHKGSGVSCCPPAFIETPCTPSQKEALGKTK